MGFADWIIAYGSSNGQLLRPAAAAPFYRPAADSTHHVVGWLFQSLRLITRVPFLSTKLTLCPKLACSQSKLVTGIGQFEPCDRV